ncbi:MAG: hypothetical protein Q9226_004731 [Calogaya cf. arnoldii]
MTTRARVPGEIAAEIGKSSPKRARGQFACPSTPEFDSLTVIVLLLNLAPRSRARANGTTTTFRRPSLATSLSHQRETSQSNTSATNQNAGVYVPPHMNSSYQNSYTRGAPSETRYSKDQLLDLFRAQREDPSSTHVSDLYVDGWHPSSANGVINGGWSRKDELKEGSAGPEMCWDHEGKVQPLALSDMTEQEKEAFSSSVNSLIKAPTQGASKDATPNSSVPGRRTSITHAQNLNAYSTSSPTARPANRRRESAGFLQNQVTSPTFGGRFGKEDTVATPPPSLLRRRTDFKDNPFGSALDEKSDGKLGEGNSPFGGLKRTATGPIGSSLNGPSSPWSAAPQSAGFPPMGTFGNFALGGSTNQPATPGERKSYGSVRGESRFKGLMNAESSEDMSAKIKEKASINSLERLAESSNEPATTGWDLPRSTQTTGQARPSDEPYQAGSAALGGDDASPPPQPPSRFDPQQSVPRDDIGFSSFGVPSTMPSFREMMQRRDGSNTQPLHAQGIQGHPMNEPMSPTTTNPYQSPEGERAVPDDLDVGDPEHRGSHMPAAAGFGHSSRVHASQFDGTASDRSRTSSAGASRGFPNLGSLGGLAGLGGLNTWSAAPGAVGTPSRTMPSASAAFADSGFGGLDDLTSPIHGQAAGSGFFGGSGNVGAIGRGSKMGSLFTTAMQEQVRGDQSFHDVNDGSSRGLGNNSHAFGAHAGYSRPGRGTLDDLLGNMDISNRNAHGVSSPFANDPGPQVTQAAQTPFSSALAGTPSLATASNSSYFSKAQEQEQIQHRQMVMPDRMRWIYRDPQGTTQGPWSGLEMHDWYKAGFFSPELQVKKLEDTDYEPLAQLIRRIGNSREPFLVPQIGIPHGSSTAMASTTAQVSGTTVTASTPASSAQPPFAGSFPSFGTTLTAEQQNALERRKQEEQYLMARQKEHLAQQQVMIKQQMQHAQGGPHGMHSQQLHHHSSAHSLQSQPSYGSITSPTGYQPSPAQGSIQPPNAMSSFFDSGRGAAPNIGVLGSGSEHLPPLREDDLQGLMERINAQRPPALGNYGGPSFATGYQEETLHQRQVQHMLLERQRLQREQEQLGMLPQGPDEPRQTAERLEQFKYLRSQMDDQPSSQQPAAPVGSAQRMPDSQSQDRQQEQDDEESKHQSEPLPQKPREPLSLSEQVQKAVKESPAQPQLPWARVETGLPQPFPPPQSSSPLPAPAAQRNRQNVADALNAESRSDTHTPSQETPSATTAPWAKETNESAKGPSLKEIQAIEARKAAQQEEIALAARRQLAEQERLNQQQQQQQVAPAPGLPSSANWANSISPAVPGSSAWAKPSTSKPTIAIPVTIAKKTLAQIQKEEEARKNRAAASAAASNAANNATTAAASAGGKRYADLAGKAPLAGITTQAQTNQAWTTVGAGGKVKTPTGTVAPAPARAASASSTQPAAPLKAKTAGKTVDKHAANEELQRWIKSALKNGLNPGITVDDFSTQLLFLPPEADIISDSIYSSSPTLDGRRFAEEFIRRRKLADKGVIPDPDPKGNSAFGGGGGSLTKDEGKGSGGGWSEVAKKGGQAEKNGGSGDKSTENYKMVAGKRKGRK